MNKSLLHTPEGVRDVYGEEYARKLFVEKKLHDTIHLYGYQDIQTPTFEFFDVYSKEIGTTPSSQLYKFFDKEGNTLALRPDFTPSCAQIPLKYSTSPTVICRSVRPQFFNASTTRLIISASASTDGSSISSAPIWVTSFNLPCRFDVFVNVLPL